MEKSKRRNYQDLITSHEVSFAKPNGFRVSQGERPITGQKKIHPSGREK
jgi:hypothetical protein